MAPVYKNPGALLSLCSAHACNLFRWMLQLIRKKLRECYQDAGVNYITDCKAVSAPPQHLLPAAACPPPSVAFVPASSCLSSSCSWHKAT